MLIARNHELREALADNQDHNSQREIAEYFRCYLLRVTAVTSVGGMRDTATLLVGYLESGKIIFEAPLLAHGTAAH